MLYVSFLPSFSLPSQVPLLIGKSNRTVGNQVLQGCMLNVDPGIGRRAGEGREFRKVELAADSLVVRRRRPNFAGVKKG